MTPEVRKAVEEMTEALYGYSNIHMARDALGHLLDALLAVEQPRAKKT